MLHRMSVTPAVFMELSFGMKLTIGVPAERRTHEARVDATPETVKKYVTQGHRIMVQSGVGTDASFPDDAFTAAGVEIVDADRCRGT